MKLKIPPPIVGLLFVLLMWLIAQISDFATVSASALNISSILVLAVGIAISITAVLSFRRAKTTVNPLKPETAAHLVNTGLYKWSRNPMYLGLLLMLVAWALWLGNALGALMPVLFVLYMNRFQILPEEQALMKLFPDEFEAFCAATRRWI